MLGFIPGLIHAWYIILKNPEPDYDDVAYEPISGGASQRRDLENGQVTYYYVSNQPPRQPSQQRAYGAVDQHASTETNAQPKPSNHPQQGGAGSSSGQGEARPPPTYAEAVQGDNKIQSQD